MHYVFFYFKKRLFWRGVWDGHRTHLFALTKPTKLETCGMASLAGTKPLQSHSCPDDFAGGEKERVTVLALRRINRPSLLHLKPHRPHLRPSHISPTSSSSPTARFPLSLFFFLSWIESQIALLMPMFFYPRFLSDRRRRVRDLPWVKAARTPNGLRVCLFFFNCFSDFGFLIMFRSGAIGVEQIFELLLIFS